MTDNSGSKLNNKRQPATHRKEKYSKELDNESQRLDATPLSWHSDNSTNQLDRIIDMNEQERLNYIFNEHKGERITNRFGWLYALLNDIQTLIVGYQSSKDGKFRSTAGVALGGGNLTIPMITCTGLELVSALYTGRTNYPPRGYYSAIENVEEFVNDFFVGSAKHLPRLIWDGVRNGINHLFIPKEMKFGTSRLSFRFIEGPSNIVKVDDDNTVVTINGIEFYDAFKQAINKYKNKLKRNAILQIRFICAWGSIEAYASDIKNDDSKAIEMSILLEDLSQHNEKSLF